MSVEVWPNLLKRSALAAAVFSMVTAAMWGADVLADRKDRVAVVAAAPLYSLAPGGELVQ